MSLSDRNRNVALSRWRKLFEEQSIRIPKDLSSLRMKSAICGFLAGDGSVQIREGKSYNHYQIDFFPDDSLMLRTYCKFVKKVYKISPSVSIRDNVFVARLSQKFVVIDLLKYCDFGIYKWSLPTKLFKIAGAREEWLRSFFSSEGYVHHKYIKIQSVNLIGMRRVSLLLKRMKIENKIYEYTPKNKNHSKVFLLFIAPYNARKKFYEQIGFYHSKKEKLLKKSLGL